MNAGGTALTTSAASGITVGSATDIAGGAAGEVPYQSAVGVTGFSAAGSAGQVLTSGGTGAPIWGALTCNSSGNVVVPAPGSGLALTVNGAAGAAAVQITSGSGSAGISITLSGASNNALLVGGPAATQLDVIGFSQTGQTGWQIYQPASTSDFRLFAGADRLIGTAAGNWTIPTPSSGVALTVNGVAGFDLMDLTINEAAVRSVTLSNTNTSGGIGINISGQNGANIGTFRIGGAGSVNIGSQSNTTVQFLSNTVTRGSISASGNWAFNAPASGDTVTSTGIAGQYAATLNGANSATGYGLQVAGGFTGSGTIQLVLFGALY